MTTRAEVRASTSPASVRAGVRDWVAALPAALLPAGLGLYQLGDPSLWVDEALTAVIVLCPAFAVLGGVALAALAPRVRAMAAVPVMAGAIGALLIWYSPDGSENWAGEDWRAATAFVMQQGGVVAVHPEWAAVAYEYYGGKMAPTGLAVERSSAGDRPVWASFGSNLHVVEERPRPS